MLAPFPLSINCRPLPAKRCVWCGVVLVVFLLAGCRAIKVNPPTDRVQPSNHREWSPEFRQLSTLEQKGKRLKLKNIRNNVYVSENDFVLNLYDREFDLDQIQSVDFVVVPFQNAPALAHTMLSFGLDTGEYFTISVEIRIEKGEKYSPILGIARQYELIYVVADERDVVRLRTHHRDADVYIYPTLATPERAQKLFLDCMARANQLARYPEFYDTLRNNCTTNLVRHVNQVHPKTVPYGWQVLLPGHSDRYAYDLGLVDNRVPFEELKRQCHINDLAFKYHDDPDFSKLIRQRSHAGTASSNSPEAEPSIEATTTGGEPQ